MNTRGYLKLPVVDQSTLIGRNVIGIDPGASPTIAVFLGGPDHVEFHEDEATLAKVRKQSLPNVAYLGRLLDDVQPDLVVLEHVTTMPAWGATTTSTFIGAFRHLWGFLEGRGQPVMLLPPKFWQAIMIVSKGGEAHRQRAMELFPQHVPEFRLKKHQHRAAACLLALSGAMICHGKAGGGHGTTLYRADYAGKFWRSWLTESQRQGGDILGEWDA